MQKVFSSFLVFIFFSGCATSNYTRYFDKKQDTNKQYSSIKINSINQDKKVSFQSRQESKTKTIRRENGKYTLKVIPSPLSSRVRILNIKPKYHDNIELKPGRYLIEVSSRGYPIYKRWIKLKKDTVLKVKLKKEQNFIPQNNISNNIFKDINSQIFWKSSKIPDRYKKFDKNTIKDSLKLTFDGNRIWYDDKTNTYTDIPWDKANNYCKNLHYYGLHWRLPTASEAKHFFTDKLNKKMVYRVSSSLAINRKNYFFAFNEVENGKKLDSYYHNFACVTSKNYKKANYSIAQLTQKIYNDIMKNIRPFVAPKKPKKPVIHSFVAPKKGEFETTKQYRQRVAKLKSVYESNVQKTKALYQKKIDEYKKLYAKAKERYKRYLKKVENDKNAIKLYALQTAFNIKYGNPKIANIKYNADKQVFDYDIVSSRLKDIRLKNIKSLKNAVLDKKTAKFIKILNFKNESLIIYSSKYYDRFKIFSLKNFNKKIYEINYKNYVFDNSFEYGNVPGGIVPKVTKVYINVPRITSSVYHLPNFMLYAAYWNASSNYNNFIRQKTIKLDPNITSDAKIARSYVYKKHFTIKIPLKNAKDFKKALASISQNPKVVFEVTKGKVVCKGLAGLSKTDDFMIKKLYTQARFDISKLKELISKYPSSIYAKKAKKEIKDIKAMYKGYEPKDLFYVEGCVGYFPAHLVSINLKNISKDPSKIKPSYFNHITWSGLCRRGLLNGRGYLKMVSKDDLFVIKIDGKMKNGFFTGDIEREIARYPRPQTNFEGSYWSDTVKRKIKLDSYGDYVKYQQGGSK